VRNLTRHRINHGNVISGMDVDIICLEPVHLLQLVPQKHTWKKIICLERSSSSAALAKKVDQGKTFMVRDGAFQGVDAALTWHPSPANAIMSLTTLANYQVTFRFKGTSAHAANAPHLGRSALDAVELMNSGA